MTDPEAVGTVLIALATIVSAFVLVAKPLLRLNSVITELEATLRHMEGVMAERGARLSELEAKEERIEDRVTDHEYRIKSLEDRRRSSWKPLISLRKTAYLSPERRGRLQEAVGRPGRIRMPPSLLADCRAVLVGSEGGNNSEASRPEVQAQLMSKIRSIRAGPAWTVRGPAHPRQDPHRSRPLSGCV